MLTLQKKEIIDLELELSTHCNADCPLCFRNYKNFKNAYPKNKFRKLKDIINQLEEYPNLKWIRLVGTVSEPTIYPYFLELVSYIKNRDILIEICTNGDTRTSDFWKKLGKLLTLQDKVYFTICGSTQEIHELYRKGTSLENILKNAQILRKECPIDYAQCIQFEYNKKDLNSQKFQELVSSFSHVYMTETYLKKNIDNYTDISRINKLSPVQNKNYEKIDILTSKFKLKTKKINCKAYNDKSQIIDIDGKAYPCYLFLEAVKNGDIPEFNNQDWDQDYSKIFNFYYKVCRFCEKNTKKYLEKKEMEYII